MPSRLQSFFARVSPATETDAELLTRFARDRDEAAFATLVGRHGPMVMGTCRRIIGDHQGSEDAFQATFLVLARKALLRPHPDSLAGWLYGVARRVALKARSKPLEPLPCREVEDRHHDPLAALSGRELLSVLEDEVHRLPADYRLPVVLCCLEGLTLEEAAARLGCTRGALRGRLERGRVRLRARLAARGIAPAAVLAVAGIPRIAAASAVTLGLRTQTARIALDLVSGSGAVPDGPRLLAEGVLLAMSTTKVSLSMGVLIAIVLAVPALLAGPIPAGKQPPAGEKARPQQTVGAMTGADGAAVADEAKPGAKDNEAIQGLWQAVELEAEGQKDPAELVEKFQLRIKADKLVFGPDTAKREHTLTLDPDAKPKAMDLTPLDGPAKGMKLPCAIYRLDGDKLTICIDKEGKAGRRPTEFRTAAGDGLVLITLERVKEK